MPEDMASAHRNAHASERAQRTSRIRALLRIDAGGVTLHLETGEFVAFDRQDSKLSLAKLLRQNDFQVQPGERRFCLQRLNRGNRSLLQLY